MRKSTIKYAKALLTPTQYKAWQSMSPRLSKKELESGKRPYGRATKKSTKLSPTKKRATTKKRKVTPAVTRGKAQHKLLMERLKSKRKSVPKYKKSENRAALLWYERRTKFKMNKNDQEHFLGVYQAYRESGDNVNEARKAASFEMTDMYL